MDKVERIGYVKSLVCSIGESINNYSAADHPIPGCTVSLYDSKESIRRRCIVARQELLNIMKELEK